MRKLIKLASRLPPEIQDYLGLYISEIKQTLHMAEGEVKAAYEETIRNDPEGREIIKSVIEILKRF